MTRQTLPNGSPLTHGARNAWHLPTAMAAGSLAWMLLMFGHELFGHGLACVSIGGQALYFDAMYFQCSDLPLLWQDQLYRAAGSAFNVVLAVLSIVCLRRLARPGGWLGYFLWISAIMNSLQAGSYIALGRFIHPGMDWPTIAVAAPPGPWNALMTVGGGLLAAFAFWSGWRYQPSFVSGRDAPKWHRVRLVLTPYLTATAVSVGAAWFVPSDDRFMMLMGGIGNSLFFLAPMLLIAALPRRTAEAGPRLAPRWAFVAVAAAVSLLYLLVVAPGWTLG